MVNERLVVRPEFRQENGWQKMKRLIFLSLIFLSLFFGLCVSIIDKRGTHLRTVDDHGSTIRPAQAQ